VLNVTYSACSYKACPYWGLLASLAALQKVLLLQMSSTDYLVIFGKRLAALRKTHGWSQERLALESGLARSYVGGIERGQRNLSLINICRLAETLKLPPHELLRFDADLPEGIQSPLD